MGSDSFRLRTHAVWGLIAKKEAAAPIAVRMLRSSNPAAREDGAAILSEVSKDERVTAALIEALGKESEPVPRDAFIAALGHSGSTTAIPALAAIIRDDSADDTPWEAIEALGRIVRKNFLKSDNPRAAALAWLQSNKSNAGS